MSVKATNFVRRIRGLSPGEKCVAFVLADHADHKGGGSFASMTTVAEEAGLAHRQNASEYVQSLENKGIIFTREKSKGGKPTIWHFNYDLEDSASVRIDPLNRSPQVAVHRSPQVAVTAVELAPNCSPSGTSTAVQTAENTPSTAVRGLQEGLEARVLKSKGESSSRVADDDDLKFEKAKSELLANELGNRDELAEAMDLVRERSSTNGGEPILNWQSYLEKSLKGFTADGDWLEVRNRLHRRKELAAKPKLTPEQIRAEQIALDNCEVCRGTRWKMVPRPDGLGLVSALCDHVPGTENNPAPAHATQPSPGP
jgi:helix-turn-helix protein